jgi:hypothetical protein
MNGSFADNLGIHNATCCSFPSLPSWVPGVSRKLAPDIYRLRIRDVGQTGAEGTSNPFRIRSGILNIVSPSHVTYGSVVRVFGRVEPNNLPLQLRYHVVQANNCDSEIVDITNKLKNWPLVAWDLSSNLDGVNVGQHYRLRATTLCPSYLQACSANPITFNVGRISVSIVRVTDVVYVDETYSIAFHVPEHLMLVTRVTVQLHCHTIYGVSETWILVENTSKQLNTVWWHVGHEGNKRPWHVVAPQYTCYVSVDDAGNTGATGKSQIVTVAKACVIADSDVTTGAPLEIGVQFHVNQNLSAVSVQLVSQSNTSRVLLGISPSEVTVLDNMLTVRHARVPLFNNTQPVAGPFLIKAYYPHHEITALSDPVNFHGWSLDVQVIDEEGLALKRPLYVSEIVYITFNVPAQLMDTIGSIEYEFYLRNATGHFCIHRPVSSADCTLSIRGRLGSNTVKWLVGETLVGDYFVVVRDKRQHGGTFLIEGQSKEIQIVHDQSDRSDNLPVYHHQGSVQLESGNGKLSRVTRKSDDEEDGLSAGAVTGIAAAILAIVALCVSLVVVVMKCRRPKHGTKESLLTGQPRDVHGYGSHDSLGTRPKQDDGDNV